MVVKVTGMIVVVTVMIVKVTVMIVVVTVMIIDIVNPRLANSYHYNGAKVRHIIGCCFPDVTSQ